MTGEPCLHVFWRGINIVILGVYVDDFLIFGTSDILVEEVKTMLFSDVKITDLVAALWVLGMRRRQTESAYILDQAQ